MPEVIRNLFKQKSVFSCRHPMHKPFGYSVSPYHVLKVKKCFPAGCVEYKWRCYNFEKGKKCPREFKHVGRGCFSCNKYHDEKINYSPETQLDSTEIKHFINEFREIESWSNSMQGRRVQFSGTVDSVRPHLKMEIDHRSRRIFMDGFYASFGEGYINNLHFDDNIYLRLSMNILTKTRLAPDDEIETEVIFTEDRGRFLLKQPRKIDLVKNNNKPPITVSSSLIARSTGKIIDGLIENCEGCHYCTMIDIDDSSRKTRRQYRRFYCLRGVSDNENCPIKLEEIIEDYKEDKPKPMRF